MSQHALTMLDKQFFEPSQLAAERAAQLQTIFEEIHREKSQKFKYRLEFRKSPHIGANAFALPSGQVLMTDEMVGIAVNDTELRGILAHEIAHVEHRHGIRSVVQNAGVFLVISILVGDITSITSLAATLPTLLVEAGYSRQFEKEADRAAGNYLIRKGLGTADYRNILVRATKDQQSVPSLISTHPHTEERVKYLQSLETSE
ncbi:MAG: M48 family metallopeptidase [Desulfobacteraceae bacterium]|nr:M48 family metallopeptidase [Desulfobacteraceae bacterium]